MPEGDQELTLTRSLKVDVIGQPRKNPVPIPAGIKGGKPGAIPNTKVWKCFKKQVALWPDCKAIPVYGLIMSVCLSINILVNLVNLCINVLELALQSGHTIFSGFLSIMRLDTRWLITCLCNLLFGASVYFINIVHFGCIFIARLHICRKIVYSLLLKKFWNFWKFLKIARYWLKWFVFN